MCGIAGIVNPGKNAITDIEKMKIAISHRGPDGNGTWIENDGSVVLGHRRLAIVDLSENGSQPMMSKSERFVLSYNGEIYNYKELRNILMQKNSNIRFKGNCDTEVLLVAFEELGLDETLRCIRGMFAIALVDRYEKKMYLIRDRIGEKPLYYGKVNGRFIFSSDLSAIKAACDVELSINRSVMNIYLKHNFIPAPYSIYEGIYKQIPGTIICVDTQSGKYETKQYYNLNTIAKTQKMTLSEKEASNQLESIIMRVIKEQLSADVPVGVFLSGGIDSSLVAALAKNSCQIQKLQTFTIGFKDSAYDEAKWAAAVAKELGTSHNELYLSNRDIVDAIFSISNIYSEPYSNYSAIPTALVCNNAKKRIKVALGGDGGDEFWAGYEQYQDAFNEWNRISRMSNFEKKIVKLVEESWILSANNKFTRHFRTNRDLPYLDCSSALEIYRKYTGLDRMSNPILIDNYNLEYACSREEEILSNIIEDAMLMDEQCCLVDDSCVKIDRAGMKVGLEIRSPLLDKQVIEYCWSMPLEYKYNKKSKILLRNILYKYVPRKLIERPKQPFWFPVMEWLREGDLREWAESLLNSLSDDKEVINHKEVLRLWTDYIDNNRWHSEIWSILMYENWRQEWMK